MVENEVYIHVDNNQDFVIYIENHLVHKDVRGDNEQIEEDNTMLVSGKGNGVLIRGNGNMVVDIDIVESQKHVVAN